jgi:hypothetical protein
MSQYTSEQTFAARERVDRTAALDSTGISRPGNECPGEGTQSSAVRTQEEAIQPWCWASALLGLAYVLAPCGIHIISQPQHVTRFRAKCHTHRLTVHLGGWSPIHPLQLIKCHFFCMVATLLVQGVYTQNLGAFRAVFMGGQPKKQKRSECARKIASWVRLSTHLQTAVREPSRVRF